MYLNLFTSCHQWINTCLILLTNFALFYFYFINNDQNSQKSFYANNSKKELQISFLNFEDESLNDNYKSNLINNLLFKLNEKNKFETYSKNFDKVTRTDYLNFHRPRHWRKKNIRDLREQQESTSSVEFFPKPQPTPETRGYVWLTSYSRIPLPVLQEYCFSSKQYCPPGEPGPPGEQGFPGHKGEKGDTGEKGFVNFSEIGIQGPPGPKGDSGRPGLDGRDGLPGEPGLDGIPGRDGKPGIDGKHGQDGLPGKPGKPGLNGTDGLPGQAGERGPIGPPGLPGQKGSQGKKGAPGKAGEPGKPGISIWKDMNTNENNTMQLLIPPMINDQFSEQTYNVKEGDNVIIDCMASGQPTPVYSWFKQGSSPIRLKNSSYIEIGGGTLRISLIRRHQKGTYICWANNGVPPQAFKKYHIVVSFQPLITIFKSSIRVQNEKFLILECMIQAFPKGIQFWTFKGERIESDKKYQIDEIQKENDSIQFVLNISFLDSTDFGTYQCVSQNAINITYGQIEVYSHDQSSQKPKYLEMRVFGETNFDFKETDCKVCLKCGCKAKDYIRAEDVSWFNNFEWFGLRERSRECKNNENVFKLIKVGKPVFNSERKEMWGCWMQDAMPNDEQTAQKYWLTLDQEQDRGLLYEYENKTAFKANHNPVVHKLLYNFTGNSHVIYNGSLFYYNNQMRKLIKYDLKSKDSSYLNFNFINGLKFLYQSKRNHVDISADENGLWAIFPNPLNNNTMVLKFNQNDMNKSTTSKIDQVWSLSLDHQNKGEMLIICGIIYPIESMFETHTKITSAFDLYTNQSIQFESDSIKFINPFKHNSLLSYNSKKQTIFGWDKNTLIEYPIIIG